MNESNPNDFNNSYRATSNGMSNMNNGMAPTDNMNPEPMNGMQPNMGMDVNSNPTPINPMAPGNPMGNNMGMQPNMGMNNNMPNPTGPVNEMTNNGMQPNIGIQPNMGMNQAPASMPGQQFNPGFNNGFSTPPKKNNLTFIIIVAVLGVVIVGLIIGLVVSGHKKSSSPSGGGTPAVINDDDNNEDSDNNDTPVTPTDNDKIIDLGYYKFTLPEGYEILEEDSDIESGIIAFINESALVESTIRIVKDSTTSNTQEAVNGLLENSKNDPAIYNPAAGLKSYNGQVWGYIDFVYNIEGLGNVPARLGVYNISPSLWVIVKTLNVGIQQTGSVKKMSMENIYDDISTMINNGKNSVSSFAKGDKEGKIEADWNNFSKSLFK